MLNPSRTRVLLLALIAFVGLVLGLATDAGLLGWSLAALLALYLAAVSVAHLARGRSMPGGRQA
jgi:amino acid transporter